MKTDTLFHELFQLAPQALFELLQIKPGCAYRFESPVVKASERRLDGLLEPAEPGYSRYFVEVQGYDDKSIYWRVLHQIGLYHAQRPEIQGRPWRAVLLFLDATYDPGPQQLGTLSDGPMPWLIRGVVPDLMQRVTEPSPILHVLRPLIAENEAQMRQQAADWVQDIRQFSTLDRAEQERLLALLVQFILQKFSHLTGKEIGQMLKLTPIEETRAVKEWMQEGFRQGEIAILAHQLEQKFSVSAEEAAGRLASLDSSDLKALSTYLLKATTYEQVEAWIDGRLATTKE